MSSGTLGKLAISLRSSFWFVPALIVLASVALAAGMVAMDRALDGAPGERWPALFASDADGARDLLAIIAGSMITVAGVVFSITIAALAQAASQYTSRVLRNFMRDRGNQAVLGVFLGVFAYCLVVMHAITPDSQQGFVPLVAVVVGLLLSLVAVAFLVALFKARPSPFYILDEVEAALDDTNLGRLLEIYEELRENSQLVVITHQKRTMGVGDALYGVTMRGDGVSAVISQRRRDAEPA